MPINKELLIVLKQQVNFEGDQKVAAIDQTTGRERMVDRDQMLGHFWLTEHETELLTTGEQCYLTLQNVTFKILNKSGSCLLIGWKQNTWGGEKHDMHTKFLLKTFIKRKIFGYEEV
jgi:hypothetical protein